MGRETPSIFKKIPRKEESDLVEAIRGKKYWNISEENKNYVYVVALSRARELAPIGYYAKTSALGKVQVIPEAAKYCRKYRILLVDIETQTAFSVLTWMVFRRIMKKNDKLMNMFIKKRRIPPYINRKILREFSKKVLQGNDN